jgi:hypothetical protein
VEETHKQDDEEDCTDKHHLEKAVKNGTPLKKNDNKMTPTNGSITPSQNEQEIYHFSS